MIGTDTQSVQSETPVVDGSGSPAGARHRVDWTADAAAASPRLRGEIRGNAPGAPVDPIIVLSALMLAVWAVGTWFDGPGWIHFLLTAGVFLLVWRIATKAQAKQGSAKK